MSRFLGVRHLLTAAAACTALASTSAAQGGWRRWDVRLRDGTCVDANPLGAPDDQTLSTSLGGTAGHGRTISRARIDYVEAATTAGPACEPLPGTALPPVPARRACTDVVVRRDGERTLGRVTLTRVAFSEGVVTQHDVAIDLRDVAYIRFAHAPRATCDHEAPTARRRSGHHD